MPKARKCPSQILKRSKRSISFRKYWKNRKDNLQSTLNVEVPVDLSYTSNTVVENDETQYNYVEKLQSHCQNIFIEAGHSKSQEESPFGAQKESADMYDSDQSSYFKIFLLEPVTAMSQEEYDRYVIVTIFAFQDV
ncbi:hypothetical protein JTB14_008658 [Gonioctena quinquepunctata]|nr:hypothetical protein JTB14_008658 [Gonioctena quinquepunctata]